MVKEVAEQFAESHKEISVAEFFEKNRHLLGFDSKLKAMLTCVKEAVDNCLDACEDYGHEVFKRSGGKEIVLPEIHVEIRKAEKGYAIVTEENEEGIAELIKRKNEWYVVYQGRQMRASSRDKNIAKYNIPDHTVKLIEDEKMVKPQVFVNDKQAKVVEKVSKYHLIVVDNGPGIVKEQIPNIFGKFLYGSKFFRLRQSRGQQGIGIHSAVLYAQLTTGRPAVITSRIAKNKPAHKVEVVINTLRNEPEVLNSGIDHEFTEDHGTQIELFIDADYVASGDKSPYEFMRRTAIINPHATIVFVDPEKKTFRFDRTSKELPKEPTEIKPHPHGIELGILMRMLRLTKQKTVKTFLIKEFSRVGAAVADNILEHLRLENKRPEDLERTEVEALLKALQKAPLQRPPTDCLSPIGNDALTKSVKKETNAEFVVAESRKPTVYRGMPFVVEAVIAYGGEIDPKGQAQKLRFANKIPLLYDAGGCAITQAIQEVDWKRYGVDNLTSNNTPIGPYFILVHLASVWVPYTSEGKGAIASYPEIIKEMKLTIQECARKLKIFLSAKNRDKRQSERRSLFEIYIPELAYGIQKLTDEKKEIIENDLKKILGKGKIEGEDVQENGKKNGKPVADEMAAEGEG